MVKDEWAGRVLCVAVSTQSDLQDTVNKSYFNWNCERFSTGANDGCCEGGVQQILQMGHASEEDKLV